MERTVFNKAQLEMLDIMANIQNDEELNALKHAISEFYARRRTKRWKNCGNPGNGMNKPWKIWLTPITAPHTNNEKTSGIGHQLFGADAIGTQPVPHCVASIS